MGDVSNLISEIKSVASKIIRRAIPIMEDIGDEESEYVEMFADAYPNLEREKIRDVLQNITTAWVDEAEKTRLGIDTFITINSGNVKITEGCSDFFAQIWAGDVYGKEGEEALQELLKDLRAQLNNVTERYLLEETERIICKK